MTTDVPTFKLLNLFLTARQTLSENYENSACNFMEIGRELTASD